MLSKAECTHEPLKVSIAEVITAIAEPRGRGLSSAADRSQKVHFVSFPDQLH